MTACSPASSDLARSCAAATAATTAEVPAAALAWAVAGFLARASTGGDETAVASGNVVSEPVELGEEEEEDDDDDEEEASISISSGGGNTSVCDVAEPDTALLRARVAGFAAAACDDCRLPRACTCSSCTTTCAARKRCA